VTVNIATADTTAPTVPTGLTATAISSSQINLSWTASTDTGGSGMAGYKIYRCQGASCTISTTAASIATTSATIYSNTGLTAATSYTYKVAAYDVAGNTSGQSASATAVTNSAVVSGAHLWSQNFGGTVGTDNANGKRLAVGADGSSIVVGDFTNTVDFGGSLLTSVGSNDIVLAKYSVDGTHLWSRRMGGTTLDFITGVAVDGNGNVFITGYFQGTADFGGGGLISAGSNDVYLAKYGSNGAYLWSKRLGGTGNDRGLAVKADSLGNVIVTGYFNGTVDFGGGLLASAGAVDVFLAKYSPSGAHVWSKRLGGTSGDIATALAVDGANEIALTGYFAGAANFGGSTLTSAGGNDVFLAKFDANGNALWSQRFGSSTGGDLGQGVGADSSGNLVLVGDFVGSIDFGLGALVDAGSGDIFVAKLTSAGVPLWSKRFGTASLYGEHVNAVSVDATTGEFALTGTILDSVNFGGDYLWTDNTYDAFVALFQADGTHLWSKRAGEGYSDNGMDVAMDASGNVLATGTFFESANFGGGVLLSPGGVDTYLVKYAP
jgi:hypothetical protein